MTAPIGKNKPQKADSKRKESLKLINEGGCYEIVRGKVVKVKKESKNG